MPAKPDKGRAEFPSETYVGPLAFTSGQSTLAFTFDCAICEGQLWAGELLVVLSKRKLAHMECLAKERPDMPLRSLGKKKGV